MSLTLRRLQALPLGHLLLFVLLGLLGVIAVLGTLVVPLFAQADTGATIPPPEPHMQFVLGLGVLAAFIAREIGSLLVGIWNKAGAWLDGKANGFKQAFAVAFTGALGLLINVIAQTLTHQTNWIVTFALSLAAGLVGTVNAAVTIDAAKSKMLAANARARL